MELMTSRWTDDRMDDLKHQVDEIGHRMEAGFAEQRSEMNARFDRLESSLEARFEKVDARFEVVESKADARFEAVARRFEKMDAKFDAVHDQIARTQETVIGLYAMLSRFSLWFAGAVAVTVVAALLALWLR
jgi:predicted nuclease with TOPRIM domain